MGRVCHRCCFNPDTGQVSDGFNGLDQGCHTVGHKQPTDQWRAPYCQCEDVTHWTVFLHDKERNLSARLFGFNWHNRPVFVSYSRRSRVHYYYYFYNNNNNTLLRHRKKEAFVREGRNKWFWNISILVGGEKDGAKRDSTTVVCKVRGVTTVVLLRHQVRMKRETKVYTTVTHQ